MFDRKSISEFRERRKRLGLSQKALAARIGASQMALSYIERGMMVKGHVALNLARALLQLEAERERT